MPISGNRVRWLRAVSYVVVFLALFGLFQTPWPTRVEMAAIRFYQRVGSPLIRHSVRCRFNPTCSNYALQALRKHGFWKGNLHTVVRLVRCSPVGLLL